MQDAGLVQHPMIRSIRDAVVRTPRLWKRTVMITLDALTLLFAIWASYALRLSDWTPALTSNEWYWQRLPSLSHPCVHSPGTIQIGDPLSAGGRHLDSPCRR